MAENSKMELTTTEQAREMFQRSGLKYSNLTREKLQALRNIINQKMKDSGLVKGSYRCHQRPFFHPNDNGRFWAGIRCRSFYFDDREAVSFNPDGFIGFAGWSDSANIKPILNGFAQWVEVIKAEA